MKYELLIHPQTKNASSYRQMTICLTRELFPQMNAEQILSDDPRI